jgi:DNA-directed RNA polymerase specialized sigma24 family protein
MNRKMARKHYRDFISAQRREESPLDNIHGQILLGGKGFVKSLKEFLSDKAEIKEIPRRQRYLGRPELLQVFHNSILNNQKRDRAIYTAHVKLGYTLKEIGDHLGIHYTTVSKVVNGVQADY